MAGARQEQARAPAPVLAGLRDNFRLDIHDPASRSRAALRRQTDFI